MRSVALKDELIGTWKLVSYVETPVDGSSQRFRWEKSPKACSYTRPTVTCRRN